MFSPESSGKGERRKGRAVQRRGRTSDFELGRSPDQRGGERLLRGNSRLDRSFDGKKLVRSAGAGQKEGKDPLEGGGRAKVSASKTIS